MVEINQGPMGYQCTKYEPCGYCCSFARGDKRKRLKVKEQTEEKTKGAGIFFVRGVPNIRGGHKFLERKIGGHRIFDEQNVGVTR